MVGEATLQPMALRVSRGGSLGNCAWRLELASRNFSFFQWHILSPLVRSQGADAR